MGEMREERKVVTALFADLVGSTALGERLDAEEVRLLVGDAVARMVHTVEGFGGTVKDLAGDGVLALFGAPVAHEDDPERAVRAGLRIVSEIAAFALEVASGWGIEGFAVRVGVCTGPVVLGPAGAGSRVEYGAYGDTVNTAARLQTAAEPGTVVVDEGTVRLVLPRFEWGPERRLELKGKSGKTTVRQAVAALDTPGRRGLSELHGPMVGRDLELGQAQEAVDAVLAGTGGILVVSGEAGIGKTRLVAELRERFEQAEGTADQEPLWLEGRCVSYGESLPYWPFRDLLRDWLGAGADDPELRLRLALRRRAEGLFGGRADDVHPYLAALLGVSPEPEGAARLAELSPEALQYRTFEVVEALLGRLAEDRPVTVVLDDLHWADPTSIQLAEQLLELTDRAALLLVLTLRPEPDQPGWQVTQEAARRLPHRTRELPLGVLAGDAGRLLLETLVGPEVLPDELANQILAHAEGNPFYLEELVASIVAEGALVEEDGGWRFDHEVPVEIPPTVEKVILARIDRLPAEHHEVLTAAAVLGREFGLPLLEGVTDGNGSLQTSLSTLQRLDLLREARRWPEPEYRFKHALIQEAAYRTLLTERRTSLHRRAAQWLETRYAEHEEEAFGLLAHHWQQADDEDKAVLYLSRAADAARREWALDEAIEQYRALLGILERRGEQQEMALVLFKLALALHVSLRFKEANTTYARAFELWTPPPAPEEAPSKTLRMATSYLPRVPDPTTAGWWFDIQLCMQLFDRLVEAWPERVIVPSLASRWEISDDGLRYVFHLREGLRWSDGEPLTAHDVEWGVKRVLDPDAPGASVSVYFVLENGQDYYLRRNRDADRIGVRALDDRTVEFRLVAPAPYFMNVVNRPDGGPQPRHAIERDGAAWAEPDGQVVSGPFRQLERDDNKLVLVRNEAYEGTRPGNVARVEVVRSSVEEAVPEFDRGDLDIVRVVYSPKVADHLPPGRDLDLGPAAWTAYLGFDHRHPVTSDERIRRALAHAIDRTAMAERVAPNYLVANGGIVPPALHGHTPDIAPRFEPDTARALFQEANGPQTLRDGVDLAAQDAWSYLLEPIIAQWADVLDLDVRLRTWRAEEVPSLPKPWELAPIYLAGWLPGYPDAEYMLRLLLHADALTNEGGISHPALDDLIDRARQQTTERRRLDLFHQADRMAVAELAVLIPLVYGRSTSFVQPNISGWWEFAKTSASYANLSIDE